MGKPSSWISRHAWIALFVFSSAASLIAACGSDRAKFDEGGDMIGGPPVGQGDTLSVEPIDAVLDVEDGKTPSVDYHAFVVRKDGTKEEVTGTSSFRLDQLGGVDLGTFDGSKFTASSTGVGKTTVRAEYRGISASTNLTLRLTKIIVAEGAPADAPTKFGGPVEASKAPSVVYPPDGVMVPPNMNVIEWHYRSGPGNDLFELEAASALLKLKVYFGCAPIGGGCTYAPSAGVWNILASAGRGQDPLEYTLRGTSAQGGGPVGVSPKAKIAFGEEDILGGIYYWNAGAGATMRYEFGVSGQTAETFMNAPKAGAGTCIGCHVLSRDGERISVGLDIPSPSPYKVFDVASRNMVFAQGSMFGGGGANFFTFSPDKTQMMVSNGINLSLRDATTGAPIVENAGSGAMPDWSPDGSSIVFARPKTPPPCIGVMCGAPGISEGSLYVMKNTGGAWGPGSAIVASAGENNYYPSYSPDGAYVVFNRASSGTSGGETKSSYDAPDATVWVARADGSGPPIALARATSNSGDSWPKWMHREQTYRGRKLMWLTFSSRRAYGLRLGSGERAQIWMVAFDPEAAVAGRDPSLPALWLPFQDIQSGNHIAQWVTRVAREGCTDVSQCESGEVCQEGVCLPAIK